MTKISGGETASFVVGAFRVSIGAPIGQPPIIEPETVVATEESDVPLDEQP